MPTIGDNHPADPGRRGPLTAHPAVLAAGVACGLAVLAAVHAGAQTPPPTEEADGHVHAVLVLEGQEIRVAFPPDLGADGPAYAELLAGTPVRVGSFRGHRALRMGTLEADLEALAAERAAAAARIEAEARAAAANQDEPAEDDASEEPGEAAADAEPEPAEPPDPELWIARNAEGWRLEIRSAGAAEGGGGTVHVVPLQHREAAAAAPVFTASAHATAAETGRLELRWGRQAWSSDFRFDELPPPPRRPRVSGRGTARQAADDNTQTARNNMLNERNETALVLPDGARISMLYWKGIDVEDEDYPRIADTPDGAVVGMIRAPVLRLKSDVSLRFADAEVPTGNLAPGFAGAYGVWLRRAGSGWRFVFNHEPDSWGTQHDPDFDAGETPVDYSRTAGSFRPLGATLVPTGDDRGRLVVHWGPHEWAADFTVVREPSDAAAVLLQPGASFRDCLSCPELVVQPEGRLALGRYEVTREEYAAFARATGYDADAGCYVLQVAPNDRGEPSASILREDASASWRYPGFWQAGRHPVACVGLDDAQAYVAWLTRTTGATYRLPTDTEWKQAAQGTRGECAANGADVSLKQYLDLRFHVTFDSPLACEQSDGAATTSEVGSYPPNEAGLFDMVGNVWEWTGDCWKDDCGLRVVRGGSWFYGPKDLHIDAGRFGSVGARYSNGGFRVARTLD